MPLIERLARDSSRAPGAIARKSRVRAQRDLGLGAVAGVVALLNLALICNLEPGGLIAIAGFQPPWPVSRAAFAWFSSTGTYLLIGGMFVVEFAVQDPAVPRLPLPQPGGIHPRGTQPHAQPHGRVP